jgi:hypothetical protein
MRAAWMLLLAVSAGCTLSPSRAEDGMYRISGLASLHSLECSQREVTRFGYNITWYDATQGLRAERRVEEEDHAVSSRTYLTVVLSQEPRGEVLNVAAERIAETSRLPVPATPAPRPLPAPVPVRRTTPKRLSPGIAATHARNLLRQCAGAVAPTAVD